MRAAKMRWEIRPVGLICGLLVLLPGVARAQANSPALKLVISPESSFVADPEAARIQMHIHNASQQTLWLYRRAKGKDSAEHIQETNMARETFGGSTVEVRLQPSDPKAASAAVTPARGVVLQYVNMPKPRLVKMAAGADYEETSIVRLHPAQADGQKPIWGVYQVALVYGANYSNTEEFDRVTGSTLWQGEVMSNTINIELRPPLPDSTGVVGGTALGPDLQPRGGIRVSVSDEQGQLIDQLVTEGDGKFSFPHLPIALYWVTGRREDALENTVTFHHEELTRDAPASSTQLIFYPLQGDDAKLLVHKPVMIRVFNRGGKPVSGVDLDATFSNGDVIDDVKATTADDGSAPMELLPGRSSFSLKQHGCADQVERVDVAPGVGVDCFKFVFDCEKK